MTPKEKAKVLVWKFYMLGMTWEQAKQCALIAVAEMINEFVPSDFKTIVLYNNQKAYWQQVKTEIEKL
jgi:hypothetical protein